MRSKPIVSFGTSLKKSEKRHAILSFFQKLTTLSCNLRGSTVAARLGVTWCKRENSLESLFRLRRWLSVVVGGLGWLWGVILLCLGALWASLGGLWGYLGPLGGLFGPSGYDSGPLWEVGGVTLGSVGLSLATLGRSLDPPGLHPTSLGLSGAPWSPSLLAPDGSTRLFCCF